MNDIADAARVIAWARDPNRKPANIAFTAGPERQAAYWIEWAQDSFPEDGSYAEQRLDLLRRIVAGWHQSGSAEVWAADALQEAADLVEQERRAAALAKAQGVTFGAASVETHVEGYDCIRTDCKREPGADCPSCLQRWSKASYSKTSNTSAAPNESVPLTGQRIPEGWKLVPTQPTVSMRDAYKSALSVHTAECAALGRPRTNDGRDYTVGEKIRLRWKAMLGAAPEPPDVPRVVPLPTEGK